MLLTAPTDWLHELASGPIATPWGKMMQAEYPPEEMDKVYHRLEPKYGHTVTYAFLIAAPLLAERLAIAAYKQENPMIAPVAPEVLDCQEACAIVSKEMAPQQLSSQQIGQVIELLQTDETMQPLNK